MPQNWCHKIGAIHNLQQIIEWHRIDFPLLCEVINVRDVHGGKTPCCVALAKGHSGNWRLPCDHTEPRMQCENPSVRHIQLNITELLGQALRRIDRMKSTWQVRKTAPTHRRKRGFSTNSPTRSQSHLGLGLVGPHIAQSVPTTIFSKESKLVPPTYHAQIWYHPRNLLCSMCGTV